MGVGCDIGTCFCIAAAQDNNNQIQFKTIRDAFMDLENDPAIKNLLKMSKINYIEAGDKLYIVGNDATTMANIFRKEPRRPLSKGVIAPGELEAEKILLILLENILGKAKVPNETCFYSVPAAPVDRNIDVIYHQAMFSKLIGSLGYKPIAMNEAAAIVYSNASKEQFSAIAVSCLIPGQKIITNRGFVNIEDIQEGDKILTKTGLWSECVPTSRPYKGDIYEIKAYGSGKVEVTEDHLLWVYRENKWSWVMAKDVRLGDGVMQPWPVFPSKDDTTRIICYDERVTSSKEIVKKAINRNCEFYELIGYFLGDGSIEGTIEESVGIGFTFNKTEIENRARVKELINIIFDKEASEYDHGENAVRIKMYSKGFSHWIRANCYDSNRVKKLPWDISELSNNSIMYLLKGLIQSDGSYNYENKELHFSNTSGNLAQFAYLAMHRLCMAPSFSYRLRGAGGTVDGNRVIESKKEEMSVRSSGYEALNYLNWMENPCKSSKKAVIHGETIGTINEIEKHTYDGFVYDVSVLDGGDPSYCVPGIAIHNCGAGMINVALLYKTVVGMSFSISGSGDWIDESVAKATGSTAGRIQTIKERGLNLLNPTEGDPKTFREREAVVIYYKSLILRILDTVKKEFLKHQGLELPNAIPFILSGGTSLAKGFKELFEAGFNSVKDTIPIPISEIRMASDPLNSVAQGLLVAALNYDEGSK